MQPDRHETPLTCLEIMDLIKFAREMDVIELKVGTLYFRLVPASPKQPNLTLEDTRKTEQLAYDDLMFMSSH